MPVYPVYADNICESFRRNQRRAAGIVEEILELWKEEAWECDMMMLVLNAFYATVRAGATY
jgi:hypothetical protein